MTANHANYTYEIECGYRYLGSALTLGSIPTTFYSCISACDNYNNMNGLGTCSGVSWDNSSNICYGIGSPASPANTPVATFEAARLIFSGYASITDYPNYASTSPLSLF